MKAPQVAMATMVVMLMANVCASQDKQGAENRQRAEQGAVKDSSRSGESGSARDQGSRSTAPSWQKPASAPVIRSTDNSGRSEQGRNREGNRPSVSMPDKGSEYRPDRSNRDDRRGYERDHRNRSDSIQERTGPRVRVGPVRRYEAPLYRERTRSYGYYHSRPNARILRGSGHRHYRTDLSWLILSAVIASEVYNDSPYRIAERNGTLFRYQDQAIVSGKSRRC